MASNLDEIASDVGTALKTILSAYSVDLGSVPEPEDIPVSVDGWFSPYVVYQLGDTRQEGATSFIGPKGDQYTMPVYVQIVAPNDSVGGLIRNKLVTAFIGHNFEWSGPARKNQAGAIYTMKRADGTTRASIMPCSFTIPGIQLA